MSVKRCVQIFDTVCLFYKITAVIYSADYNSNIIYNFEFFNVIPHSTQYENVIKVFGYINNGKLKLPIIDAFVMIYEGVK